MKAALNSTRRNVIKNISERIITQVCGLTPMAGQIHTRNPIYFRATTNAETKLGHLSMKSALNFIANVSTDIRERMIMQQVCLVP